MILDRFLKKLGVTSYLDLNEEERKTYKMWERALNGRRLTDDDVSNFFDKEIEEVISLIPQQRLGSKDDTFLKVKLEFLRKARAFLSVPDTERKAAEAAITQMLEGTPT